MTGRIGAGSRATRGPVRLRHGAVAVAASLLLPANAPAHAAHGPLVADCFLDRSGLQTIVIAAYAAVAPGDVASNLIVECTVTGLAYGHTDSVAATAVGVAVVAAGVGALVGPDRFEVCYEARATFVGGGTATFGPVCETP